MTDPDITSMREVSKPSTNGKADQHANTKKSHWFSFERNEIFLLFSYFLFGIAFANYEPYAPLWLNEFFNQDSFLIIGFVVVIPSLIGIIGAPVWGLLADKFGSKKFVIIGMCAYCLMFVSLIFTPSSTYFLIMILIGYLIGAAQTNNLYVLASKSTSRPKEVIMAKFTIAVSLAFAIFSPLVGWIYDNFVNSMIIQLSIAIGASAIALVLIFFVKEKSIQQEKGNYDIEEETRVSKEPITTTPFTYIGVLLVAFFFQIGAGFWAYSSIYFLKTPTVSLFNNPNKGQFFSIFLIIKTVLAIPLSFLLGRVKKRNRMGLIIMGFNAYFVVVYTLLTIFPTNWIMLLIMYGLPMYPIYNVFFYSLASYYSNAKRRASALGFLGAVGAVGYISGILIIGAFADFIQIGKYVGIFVAFPVSLCITIISLLTSMIFYLVKLRKEIERDVVNELVIKV